MNGIIVAIEGKKAVLLDKTGSFVQIPNRGYRIGQTISAPHLHLRQIASVAAVFVLLCVCAFSFAYYTPTSVMRVTINPDFALSLNCFDRVIRVDALNEDAAQVLLNQPKLRGNTAHCITRIVEAAAQDGYLSEENAVVHITADTKKAPVAEKARQAITLSMEEGTLPQFVEITTATEEGITVADTPTTTKEQPSPSETLVLEPKQDTDDKAAEVLVSDTEPKKEKSAKEAVKPRQKNNKPKTEAKPAPQNADTSVASTQTKPADQPIDEKPMMSQENKSSAPSHIKTENKEVSKENTAQERESASPKAQVPSFTPIESTPPNVTERNDSAEDKRKDTDKDNAEKPYPVPENQEKKPMEKPYGDAPKDESFEEFFLPPMENIPMEDMQPIEKVEEISQTVKDFFSNDDDTDEKDNEASEKDEENRKDNPTDQDDEEDDDDDDDDDDRFDEDKKPVEPKDEALPKDDFPKEALPKEVSPSIPADKEPQKPSQAPVQKPKENTPPADNKPAANPQGGNEKPASSPSKPQPPTGGGKHFFPED